MEKKNYIEPKAEVYSIKIRTVMADVSIVEGEDEGSKSTSGANINWESEDE